MQFTVTAFLCFHSLLLLLLQLIHCWCDAILICTQKSASNLYFFAAPANSQQTNQQRSSSVCNQPKTTPRTEQQHGNNNKFRGNSEEFLMQIAICALAPAVLLSHLFSSSALCSIAIVVVSAKLLFLLLPFSVYQSSSTNFSTAADASIPLSCVMKKETGFILLLFSYSLPGQSASEGRDRVALVVGTHWWWRTKLNDGMGDLQMKCSFFNGVFTWKLLFLLFGLVRFFLCTIIIQNITLHRNRRKKLGDKYRHQQWHRTRPRSLKWHLIIQCEIVASRSS